MRALAESLDDPTKLLKERNPDAVALLGQLPSDAKEQLTGLLTSFEKSREARKFSLAGDLLDFKKLVKSLDIAILSAKDVEHLILGSARWSEEEKKVKSVPWRFREYLDQLKQVIELEELFPDVEIPLRRKAALLSLCLWGEPNSYPADSGHSASSADAGLFCHNLSK